MNQITKRIEKLTDRMGRAVERAQKEELRRLKHEVALPLLNRFQRRIRLPVELCYRNGDWWLGNPEANTSKRFVNLNTAIAEYAIDMVPITYGTRCYQNYVRRCVRMFPELVELWALCYALDSSPGRPMFHGGLKPTVKPRK